MLLSEFSYTVFSFPGRLRMLASINGEGGHPGESALAQEQEPLRVTISAQWAQSGHLVGRWRDFGGWGRGYSIQLAENCLGESKE